MKKSPLMLVLALFIFIACNKDTELNTDDPPLKSTQENGVWKKAYYNGMEIDYLRFDKLDLNLWQGDIILPNEDISENPPNVIKNRRENIDKTITLNFIKGWALSSAQVDVSCESFRELLDITDNKSLGIILHSLPITINIDFDQFLIPGGLAFNNGRMKVIAPSGIEVTGACSKYVTLTINSLEEKNVSIELMHENGACY